jgi:KDO2-lipid IV(A) lauroyltransferase
VLIALAKALSFVVFVILRHLLKYRLPLVVANLTQSFPQKTPAQLRRLTDDYFHHISDLLVEPFLFSIVSSSKRHQLACFINPQLLTQLHSRHQSVVLIASHYGNWEYLVNLPQIVDYPVYSAYSPVKNRFIDRLLFRFRTRMGAQLIPRQQFYRQALHLLQPSLEPNLVVLLADQRPAPGPVKHHVSFLHQRTGVQFGAERLATATDSAVVYLEARKTGRFQYAYTFRLLQAHAGSAIPMAITKKYFQSLERAIVRSPAYWLWSHNRWKFNASLPV